MNLPPAEVSDENMRVYLSEAAQNETKTGCLQFPTDGLVKFFLHTNGEWLSTYLLLKSLLYNSILNKEPHISTAMLNNDAKATDATII